MSLSRQVTFCPHYLNDCYVCLFIFINIFFPLSHPIFAHSLSFGLTQYNIDVMNLIYEGDAKPSYGMVVELNHIDQFFRVGRCTYKEPLHLWDGTHGSLADFSTHFNFWVGSHNLNNTNFSGGFAFFLAPVGYPIPPNSAGGSLGLFNTTTNFAVSKNHIVAVEFDSFSDKEWDPPGPHVGINVNQISSVVNTSWDVSYGDVWITYSATTRNLTVFWTNGDGEGLGCVFPYCSSLSYHIDLREVLPEWVTIGFSAATGLYPQWHKILSWDFNSNFDSYGTSTENKVKRKKASLILVVALISFFVLMVGVAICTWLVVKKRKTRVYGNGNSINMDLQRLALPKTFSYKELVAATNGFANDRRLGRGGSGQVYKGIVQDLGCPVAVKRIFAESEHYEKVFINEVKIISRLIHRNLVQFIGWCHEQGECLLVYAYMPNGSLDTHLFGTKTTLKWDFRFKIALGLASALHYLHEDVEKCVLHRDIKSANILLDNEFNTKLGDFGIAKLVDPQLRTQTTGVVGTFGYIAPEYANGGKASKECDMFSFGVVALELACGRRNYQDGGFYMPLVSWVWQLYLAGNLLTVADERLDKNFDNNEMECLLIVGLWCTHPNNKERPNAGQVMKVLQLDAPLPELPPDMHDHSLLPQHQLVPLKGL